MANTILVKNRNGKGTLIYYPASGIPVFSSENIAGAEIQFADSAVPERFAFDPVALSAGRFRQRLLDGPTNQRSLVILPTNVCAQQCSYCYLGERVDYEPVWLDLGKLSSFVKRYADGFKSVIVFGGDSLMPDGLAAALKGAGPHLDLHFVTGLGFPKPIFERKVSEAVANGVSFTLSIDPPPEPGKAYTRVYKLYPDGWYDELIRRAAWITKTFPEARWGVRSTLTDSCFDWRRLRTDLTLACGRIPSINLAPEHDVATDTSSSSRVLDGLEQLLSADVDDILAGILPLQLNKHLFDYLQGVLNPAGAWAPGGCYDFMARLSIFPDGSVSFCNEAPSDDVKFGHLDTGLDLDKWEVLMRSLVHNFNSCEGCDYHHVCGNYCPLKTKTEGGPCGFYKLKSQAVLKLLANVEPVAAVNVTLERRLKTLSGWQANGAPTEADFKAYSAQLLNPRKMPSPAGQARRLP